MRQNKYYYAPIKANRNATKVSSPEPYKAVSKLTFSQEELTRSTEVRLKGFAKDKHVKLFKITVSTNRVDYITTNDKTQESAQAAQDESGFRWVIDIEKSNN